MGEVIRHGHLLPNISNYRQEEEQLPQQPWSYELIVLSEHFGKTGKLMAVFAILKCMSLSFRTAIAAVTELKDCCLGCI